MKGSSRLARMLATMVIEVVALKSLAGVWRPVVKVQSSRCHAANTPLVFVVAPLPSMCSSASHSPPTTWLLYLSNLLVLLFVPTHADALFTRLLKPIVWDPFPWNTLIRVHTTGSPCMLLLLCTHACAIVVWHWTCTCSPPHSRLAIVRPTVG